MIAFPSRALFFALLIFSLSGCVRSVDIASPSPSAPATAAVSQPSTSSLWGESGERWKPDGRLPDFSYAGYAAGERSLPSPTVTSNLKADFGAVGDGKADDTSALKRAVSQAPDGTLFLPKGTYRLSDTIRVERSDLVLRGEGTGETVLFFEKSLAEIHQEAEDGEGPTPFSFGPGLLQVKGYDPIDASTLLTRVIGRAQRGDNRIEVQRPKQIAPGDWVRLVQSDPKGESSGSLLRHILADDTLDLGAEQLGAPDIVRFLTRVKSVEGSQVVLERPLPYDIEPDWQPELHRYQVSVRDVGLEAFSLRFPDTSYPGHFKEQGYNGILLRDVSDCWVRDVEITNSDYALALENTSFCTVTGVLLNRTGKRVGLSQAFDGHHGIDISRGVDNLINDFRIEARFVHDISVEWYSLHTVFANGSGLDLNMDLHREFNHASLFSNLDLGEGTRPFASGGAAKRGPHSGAFTTYWNLRAKRPLLLPPDEYGAWINFVGVNLAHVPSKLPRNWLVESSHIVSPKNLHEAMAKRRLSLTSEL